MSLFMIFYCIFNFLSELGEVQSDATHNCALLEVGPAESRVGKADRGGWGGGGLGLTVQ